MKNLNTTIEKATMPKANAVKSASRKLICSLLTVLFLLTCSLSTMAKSGFTYRHLYHYGYGFFYGSQTSDNSGKDMSNPYLLPFTLGFGTNDVTYNQDTERTGSSPFVNNYGDPTHSGNDKYLQLTVNDDGYVTIQGDESEFDSVFYLFDSSWNLITSGDDGAGSGDPNHLALQPWIVEYLTAGTYYVIVDGTDKYGDATSGDMLINFSIQAF
ncbi:hypothetical protein [Mucilaginibacter panaciglaebae]|uniref:Peptidase C-terminal archaeal/bacterial domain-containing protein n=1 Tax=Mucilaginibacter panaciglaebae TaxID=502331 RepID=A0ABP7X5X4_9SPHI